MAPTIKWVTVTLIVPQRGADGRLPGDEHWAHVETILAELMGGFTKTWGAGTWIANDNNVVEEPVFVYAATCIEAAWNKDVLKRLEDLRAYVKQAWEQEEVYMTVGCQLPLMVSDGW